MLFSNPEKRRVAILGSTGSIGTQTLSIVRDQPDKFSVTYLSALKNTDLLLKQIKEFQPIGVGCGNDNDRKKILEYFPHLQVFVGQKGLSEIAMQDEADWIVMGVSGFSALLPTFNALSAKKNIALASKEVLVVAGSLIQEKLKNYESHFIPVDSEHCALFQLLKGQNKEGVSSLVLTASGGPFWNKQDIDFNNVTPEMAVQHPKWKMGKKISVDSALLMNKALELVEAVFLFDVPVEKIEVVIHPQSIVHGMVWFNDGTATSQLNRPDMKASIGYALSYPQRLSYLVDKLSLKELSSLEFFPVDENKFPAISLAKTALRKSQAHVIALNASNEVFVDAFLTGKIKFSQIIPLVSKVLEQTPSKNPSDLNSIVEWDQFIREISLSFI